MRQRIAMMVLAIFAASSALELGESVILTGAPGLAQRAEAVVGRPLTPVSVAGASRRTVRRCAAGVYNC